MLNPFETSEAIVAGIKIGNKLAEHAMVEKYGGTLIYILEKRTGDRERAKDLQQETFLIVLQRLRSDSLSDPSKLSAYLQKTAINLYIGEVRKDIRRNTTVDSSLLDALAENDGHQYQQLLEVRAKESIQKMLSELQNNRDREILTLFYIEDIDKENICQELELSYRHFDRVISRARLRFRNLVEERHDEIPLEISK